MLIVLPYLASLQAGSLKAHLDHCSVVKSFVPGFFAFNTLLNRFIYAAGFLGHNTDSQYPVALKGAPEE